MTIINLIENLDQNFLLLQFNNKKKILEKISPLFFLSLSFSFSFSRNDKNVRLTI